MTLRKSKSYSRKYSSVMRANCSPPPCWTPKWYQSESGGRSTSFPPSTRSMRSILFTSSHPFSSCHIFRYTEMPMRITGIFYHPSYSRRSYLTVGARLADFPKALDKILTSDRVRMYEPGPIRQDLLLKVHTPALIEAVKGDPLCSTARH